MRESAAAGPWFHASDFARLKAELIAQCSPGGPAEAAIHAVPPAALYDLAPLLGLSPAQLACRVAQFLWLPYLESLSPGDRAHPSDHADDAPRACLRLSAAFGPRALAVANPFDAEALDPVAAHTDEPAPVYMAAPSVIAAVLAGRPGVSHATASGEPPPVEAEVVVDGWREDVAALALATVIRHPNVVSLVNAILAGAVRQAATDIHLDPRETGLVVRYRIGGVLVDAMHLPNHAKAGVIPRLKALARLDLSERRRVQDGRARMRVSGRRFELQLSTLPTPVGERLAVRVVERARAPLPLGDLGLAVPVLDGFRRAIHGRPGLVIVAGPSGSGKARTIYAALNELRSPSRSLVTLERAVACDLEGVTQIEADPGAGLSAVAGLRSVLAQDPNVVYLDAIADAPTMRVAHEASQSRCVVLTAMDVPDAAAAVTRMRELGLEPYQITGAVGGILVQRRLRRLCGACGVAEAPAPDLVTRLALDAAQAAAGRWMAARGCEACQYTGYVGHLTIGEWVVLTRDVRALITTHASEAHIREAMRREQWVSLFAAGLATAADGVTTIEELLRAVPPIEAGRPVLRPTEPGAGREESVEAPQRATRVLVLEDDADTQAALVLLLEQRGYETATASDGVEALLHLGRQAFDLVLSDVNMPTVDGLTLLSMMRDKGLRVPVVFLTADGSESLEEQCLQRGAADFIRKPIRKDVLLLRVQHALC